jgi:ABC-type multidrug transport system ATPase subunit
VRIDLSGVGFSYPGGSPVLQDVNLTWSTGVVGLLGVNGAGKSTLLRLIATLTRPKAGRVTYDGAEARGAELKRIRRSVGYLPQGAGWPAGFTVLEFCSYMGWLHGLSSKETRTASLRALELVDLADSASVRMGKLSGGQLRRVLLAQAIVHGPEVLILDEPTAGLDPRQRVRFRELVRKLAVDRLVVLSTHLVEDVAAVSTSVAVLHEGRVWFEGTPADLESMGTADDEGDNGLERGFSRVLSKADEMQVR